MAAGNTYVAIAEQTLGTAAASVTFSSISGAYTDLVIVAQASNDSSAGKLYVCNLMEIPQLTTLVRVFMQMEVRLQAIERPLRFQCLLELFVQVLLTLEFLRCKYKITQMQLPIKLCCLGLVTQQVDT
jgi:hypothetical protein